jgi:hypothetical protein
MRVSPSTAGSSTVSPRAIEANKKHSVFAAMCGLDAIGMRWINGATLEVTYPRPRSSSANATTAGSSWAPRSRFATRRRDRYPRPPDHDENVPPLTTRFESFHNLVRR